MKIERKVDACVSKSFKFQSKKQLFIQIKVKVLTKNNGNETCLLKSSHTKTVKQKS